MSEDKGRRLNIDVPEEVISLIKRINRHRYEAYLVGGSVRDRILKREIFDWDIATSAPPAVIMRLFRKT